MIDEYYKLHGEENTPPKQQFTTKAPVSKPTTKPVKRGQKVEHVVKKRRFKQGKTSPTNSIRYTTLNENAKEKTAEYR